jgi:hypothetical protein
MKIQVLPPARAELADAAAYYEQQQGGLGLRLWVEVDLHIEWIARNPAIPRLRSGGYRRVNLKTFPYYLAYIDRGDTLWILAIANAYCRPEYWIGRMKSAD